MNPESRAKIGAGPTSVAFFEVALFGVAKRWPQIALGGSPRKQANMNGLSREAAAEVGGLQSAAASRLKAFPFVTNLGLTPKAIRWRCFAAQKS